MTRLPYSPAQAKIDQFNAVRREYKEKVDLLQYAIDEAKSVDPTLRPAMYAHLEFVVQLLEHDLAAFEWRHGI